MATMIPAAPPDFNDSEGEERVFEALRLLPDPCYVFHSLRWIHKRRQGEADFVVFDPKRGILVLEVKAGIVRCAGREWFSRNRNTGVESAIKDPEKQADANKWALREKLDAAVSRSEKWWIGHAVWFPSGHAPASPPPNCPTDIVLDERNLKAPAEAVHRVLGNIIPDGAVSLSPDGVQQILNVLAPVFEVTPSLRQEYEHRERLFVRMTAEQARVLDYLDEQRTAAIAGVAGTGKTLLAVEKARRLAAGGGRVLFLCYNAALRSHLSRSQPIDGVDYETFHSAAGRHVPGNAGFAETEKAFLDYLADEDTHWGYEHLIIDEGQDFESDWVSWLKLRTPGAFYVFYDRHQLIQRDEIPEWLRDAECRLLLKRNCRNTFPIARTSLRCAGLSFERAADALDGPKTNLYDCTAPGLLRARCEKVVDALVRRRGLSAGDIVILTMESTAASGLGAVERLTGLRVVEEPGQDAVCFTTVRKFKGLEAKAILVVDAPVARFADRDWRSRMYVAASRARHELHILFEGVDQPSLRLAAEGLRAAGTLGTKKTLARQLDATWQEEDPR